MQGAPWWVFPLLALLIWRGVNAARPRTVRWRLVFIVPIVFIAWGLAALALASLASPALVADWFATAAVGCLLALFTARFDGLRADRTRGLVHLPGSWGPLARFMLIFWAKYAIGVSLAMRPNLGSQLKLLDIAVSGLATGYFLGWLFCFRRAYLRLPQSDLAAIR